MGPAGVVSRGFVVAIPDGAHRSAARIVPSRHRSACVYGASGVVVLVLHPGTRFEASTEAFRGTVAERTLSSVLRGRTVTPCAPGAGTAAVGKRSSLRATYSEMPPPLASSFANEVHGEMATVKSPCRASSAFPKNLATGWPWSEDWLNAKAAYAARGTKVGGNGACGLQCRHACSIGSMYGV